jgi:hypothetical protein
MAARGFVVTLRILRNSTHRIKRRIQRMSKRLPGFEHREKRNARIGRRIALHRWRLSARRLAIKWLENYAHEYDRSTLVARLGDRLAATATDGETAPFGAAYPWETRGAAA